jgi:hypothetical protein
MLNLIRLEEVQSISAQFQIIPIALRGGTVLVRRQIRTATRSAARNFGTRSLPATNVSDWRSGGWGVIRLNTASQLSVSAA